MLLYIIKTHLSRNRSFSTSFPQPQRIKSVDSKAKTPKNRKFSTDLVSLNNNII